MKFSDIFMQWIHLIHIQFVKYFIVKYTICQFSLNALNILSKSQTAEFCMGFKRKGNWPEEVACQRGKCFGQI